MTETSYSPLRWPLHILIICYYLAGFIVRFAWPPLIPIASPELGITMAQAGSYMSAFYIGYVLAQIPAGVMGDRFGIRYIIALALALEGISTFLLGLTSSFSLGFWLRIISGLGAGAVYASCIRSIAISFPKREWGLAFGLLLIAPTGGGVLLPNLLMPWLSSLFSWQGALRTVGIIALVLAVLAGLFLRDKGGEVKPGSPLAGLKEVLSCKPLVMVALAGLFYMWSLISFISWGNAYVKDLGFTIAQAGLVMIAFSIGGSISPPLGGKFVDKAAQPKWILIIGGPITGLLVLLFGNLTSLPLLAAMAAVLGFAYGFIGPVPPLLVNRFAGAAKAGTAGGVSGSIFQIGAIVGPALAGMSVDQTGSFATAWLIIGAVFIPCALLLLLVPRTPPA